MRDCAWSCLGCPLLGSQSAKPLGCVKCDDILGLSSLPGPGPGLGPGLIQPGREYYVRSTTNYGAKGTVMGVPFVPPGLK